MAKFNIDEEVAVKAGNKCTLVINQIVEITCSAGTQTSYEGRVWQGDLTKHKVFLTKPISFAEHELEKLT